MKIRIMSDLHLNPYINNGGFEYIDHDEEVCILAGDIAEGMNGVNWAVASIPSHIQVLYVPGNHEYYGQEYFSLNKKFEKWNTKGTHVKVLLNESFDFNGKHFVGSTLWTNFNYFNTQEQSTKFWYGGLNDSRFIRFLDRQFLHTDMIALHDEALDFLGNESGILITHYCPHLSVAERFKFDRLTAGFASVIPNEIWDRYDVHIHGHTHDPFFYKKDTHPEVICNPRGYEHEYHSFVHDLVMEV